MNETSSDFEQREDTFDSQSTKPNKKENFTKQEKDDDSDKQ